MNKVDLAAEVASRTGMTKAESLRFVNAAIAAVMENVQAGERVSITGLGSFETKNVAPRIGRNPKTGEEYPIPASRKAVFKPGTALREALTK